MTGLPSGSPDPPHDLAPLLEQALARHDRGELAEAKRLFQEILRRDPRHFIATHQLGAIQNQEKDFEGALLTLGRALELHPRSAIAHFNMGVALGHRQRPEEALAHYQFALALNPAYPEALLNCAGVLRQLHRPEEGLQRLRKLQRLRPEDPDVLRNLGILLQDLRRSREALDCYERALALDPQNAHIHSCKIFQMDFLPELGFAEHQRERRAFCARHARGFQASTLPFANAKDPSRPLVVGYVSADFNHHSAALCFGPVLRRHDKSRFRIVCYSGAKEEDDWTQVFQAAADSWRPAADLADEALAAQIRADRIDILVDLSGHSLGNRLPVFARKPAPIQVTAWGHCGGTGLPAMDYQFTDPVFTPAWARPLFAEESIDLPACITFEAPPHTPPVAPPPFRSKDRITFGCLSRIIKMGPEALDLWSGVLRAVPEARLLLKDSHFDDDANRAELLEQFETRGIQGDRLELRGRTSHLDHLRAYHEVDIALDTVPYNGGITTWEALWMGAPVLALLGNQPSARLSAAILTALGLGDWVARDGARYLELAVQKARDREALVALRAGLRSRIEASPAGNPELYTRAVEAAYRAMWTRWLAQDNPA